MRLQTIKSCDTNAVDIACGTSGENTRLAISAAPVCAARVVTLPTKPGDPTGPLREYSLTDPTYPPSQMTERASFEMTPDGRFLVSRDHSSISLIELFDDHAQVLRTWAEKFPFSDMTPAMHALDMSMNGRVVAYLTDQKIKVIHIPDGEKLLELDFGNPAYAALSPSGDLLAIPLYSKHCIRFYPVPPHQDTEHKLRDAP